MDYKIKNLIADIWMYLRPYKRKFFLATILRASGDLAWLYPSYAIAFTVEFLTSYTSGQSINPLYLVLGLYILASIVRYGGLYSAKMICFKVGNKASLDAKAHVMKHLFHLDIAWHEKENSGNKMKRIDNGGLAIEKILRMWINNFIEIGINFVGMIFIIAQFDLLVGGIMVFFVVAFYFLSTIYRKRGAAAARLVNIQEENVNGLIFESLNNIRTIKAMGMGVEIMERLNHELGEFFQRIKKRIFWFQTGSSGLNFFGITTFIAIFVLIVAGILHGEYKIGFLILFNGYFGRIWTAVTELIEVGDVFATSKIDIQRMQAMLSEPVTIDLEEGKVSMPRDWQAIKIRDLSFSYGEKEVLSDVSFEIPRGKKVGIIGLSGAGKSTLFKLLLKENESYKGEILFDETPLRGISKSSYLKDAAVVLQETELFNTSLRENISVFESGKSREVLLQKAIEVAHVKDFMDKLPLGVETLVGEKGVKLSGGEKQRVGIARAVYKEPTLLLMDEATSHLDIESEKKIQESLHEFFKEVTAVVIAHRLTTIKEMDKIIVIEDGKIVETGSFDELFASKGRFFELWEKQKL